MTTQHVPIEHYLVGVPRRRAHRWCRDGRIANAIKIGRQWFVRIAGSDADRDVAKMLASLGYEGAGQ